MMLSFVKNPSAPIKTHLSNQEKSWILHITVAAILGMGCGIVFMFLLPMILTQMSLITKPIPQITFTTLFAWWPFLVFCVCTTLVLAFYYGVKIGDGYLDRKSRFRMIQIRIKQEIRPIPLRSLDTIKPIKTTNPIIQNLNNLRIGILHRQVNNSYSNQII